MEMRLSDGSAAYLLGRNGATKNRLVRFSGAKLELSTSGNVLQIIGTPRQQELAKLCIDVTLSQQKPSAASSINHDEVEARADCDTLDVVTSHVGFLLGAGGKTMRDFQTKHRSFMFFDNKRLYNGKKRLYILGSDEARRRSVDECRAAMRRKDEMTEKAGRKQRS